MEHHAVVDDLEDPMQASTWVCVPCSRVARGVIERSWPQCGNTMTDAGARWRPPRRRNKRAWTRIASGDWATELPPQRRRSAGGTRPVTRRGGDVTRALQELDRDPASAASAELVRHPDTNIRFLVAGRDDTPIAQLLALVRDADPTVRVAAVSNAVLPLDQSLRMGLLTGPVEVRRALVARGDLDVRLARRLLRDSDRGVALRAAQHSGIPVRDLRNVPLTWVPASRLPELASGLGLAALSELHKTCGPSVTVDHAINVITAALS